MKPRKHQAEIAERGQSLRAAGASHSRTILDVVPGGGKSRCIPTLYREAGMKKKVIWVAPRRSLQAQAVEAAAEGVDGLGTGGLNLAPDVHSYRQKMHDGFVSNYSNLAKNIGLHKSYFDNAGEGSLLVLDEVHHCGLHVGDDVRQPSWTAAVQMLASQKDRHHLLLTGTPYRGDRRPVYGVPYDEDGRLIRDDRVITYGRRDARKDHAITPNRMYWLDGPTVFTLREKGEDVPYCLNSFRDLYQGPMNARKAKIGRAALRAFLSYQSVEKVHKPAIWQAWCSLGKRRTIGFKKAQMIVTVDNQGMATMLRDWMCSKGIRTALAVCDFHSALEEVQDFRRAEGYDALITVGMAYEGLDAPYVTHLVHLGRTRQPSWLMQYFARAWRWGPREWPQNHKRRTFIFAPYDPAMLRAVRVIDHDILGEALPALTDAEPEESFGKPVDDTGWSGDLSFVTPGLIF